jgi:hypothetical protein
MDINDTMWSEIDRLASMALSAAKEAASYGKQAQKAAREAAEAALALSDLLRK